MDGPSWSLWLVPVVAFAGIAVFISSVYLAERAQNRRPQRGAQSVTAGDRRHAGGPARQSVSDEERPPRSGDREREMHLAQKGG